MTYAIVVAAVLALLCLLVAGLPASARRRVAEGDVAQLDVLVRSVDRTTSALPGVVALPLTLVAATLDLRSDGDAWPVWLLGTVLAATLVVLARRARASVTAILLEGGATPPADGDPGSAPRRPQD